MGKAHNLYNNVPHKASSAPAQRKHSQGREPRPKGLFVSSPVVFNEFKVICRIHR